MIGVFDSGYGGLTILRALVEKLPEYDYLYVGDNARAPYGNRSSEEIYEFTRQGVEHLFQRGCQLVILGCNTASAVALRRLQQEWLPTYDGERRILGILVPTIEQITGVPWKHEAPALSAAAGTITVGVLATEQTVQSGAYEVEIHKRNPSMNVVQQACPGLVEAIEAGKTDQELRDIVQSYIQHLAARVPRDAAPLRAVLLGCTHYELIAPLIISLLPPEAHLYHQPTIVAKSLAEYLVRHTELAARFDVTGKREFFTTGDPASVSSTASRYFGQPINFKNAAFSSAS